MSDDWRTFFDKEYVGAWDLPEKGITVVFDRIKQGELTGTSGLKARKLVAWFRGGKKPMAFNTTNCKTVAAMYGKKPSAWIGKAITIFPTTTSFGGQTVDCIRVKPMIPQAPNNTRGGSKQLPDESESVDEDPSDAGESEESDEERAARIDRGEE